MDDISLTYLFGMKIVICVGCRKQVLQRLKNKAVNNFGKHTNLDIRVTDAETLHIVEEEAGFCRFEVERLLNRCLRNKGADCQEIRGRRWR
jgi:amino-acid N-acetyltransferase